MAIYLGEGDNDKMPLSWISILKKPKQVGWGVPFFLLELFETYQRLGANVTL
jgi:hypothetical protein